MKASKNINPLEKCLSDDDKIELMIQMDYILSKVRIESRAIPQAFSELIRLFNSDN